MKFPLSWLKEWLPLTETPLEIAEALTSAGLEVDSLTPKPLAFEGVVIAEVLSAEPHPNAERLKVAQVATGVEGELLQIVCGAPNCRAGIRAPLAKVGATLNLFSEPFKIKRSTIRGVESQGMLCSEEELGLSATSDGIAELPLSFKLGAALADYYGDTLFELSLTPNLAHCASILGIARELSSILKHPIREPTAHLKESEESIEGRIAIQIDAKEACPRYACRIVRGVKVGPSPAWLVARLGDSGLRSVNNVVDVINFVMLERGHPMHAFDLDRLKGGRIDIRFAKEGEEITTLDGSKRSLSSDNLLISDGAQPVAIAGIIGGEESAVHEGSCDLLIESAYFLPAMVRRSSKALGLKTDSSIRFERGTDPNGVTPALNRAALLLQQVCGGEPLQGVLDIATRSFPEKHLTCRVKAANALLGSQLAIGEAEELFRRLHFHVTARAAGELQVDVPTYRTDVISEVDLIEELARLYGYNNLPKAQPRYTTSQLPHTPLFSFEREIRTRLIGEGLQEIITSSLISPYQTSLVAATLQGAEIIEVLNPSSSEQSVMRPSLLPSACAVARRGAHHGLSHAALFEIGRVYFEAAGNFQEKSQVGIFLTGPIHPPHWAEKAREVDFFDLKRIIENLFAALGLSEPTFLPSLLATLHPGRQAHIVAGGQPVGALGEVHPATLRAADFSSRAYFGELNLDTLIQLRQERAPMRDIPLFPSSIWDWTVTVKEEVTLKALQDAIWKARSRLLKKLDLLDIFRGVHVGEGRKNVTFRFVYRDDRKTVSQSAVEAEHQRITAGVMRELGI